MMPDEFIQGCEDRSLKNVLVDISSRGFGIQTLEVIKEKINRTSYELFADLLAKSLNIDFKAISGDDRLQNYLYSLAVDITNQYSAHRNLEMSAGLNFHWFRYSGSNLTNTRKFCLAMTQKDYFHRCEIPSLISGEFEEFENISGDIDDMTELPRGLYSQTDDDNFLIYRGGYGCGHSIHPISDSAVPDLIKNELYSSSEYELWLSHQPD